MITEEEREAIYTEEKTVSVEFLGWDWSRKAYRINAPVLRPNGEELTLLATRRRTFSFALLYNKTLIRQWDFRIHNNPGGRKIVGPHKHKWTLKYGREEAYEVDDVPTDDPNEALLAFLKECNIRIEGDYQLQFVLGR